MQNPTTGELIKAVRSPDRSPVAEDVLAAADAGSQRVTPGAAGSDAVSVDTRASTSATSHAKHIQQAVRPADCR